MLKVKMESITCRRIFCFNIHPKFTRGWTLLVTCSNVFGYKAFGNGYYVGIKEPGGIVTPLLTGNHALPANGRAPEKGNRVIICCKLRSIWLFVGVGSSSTWPVPCVGCALNPGLPSAPVPENWSS